MRDDPRRLAAIIAECAAAGNEGRFRTVELILNPRAGAISSARKLKAALLTAERWCAVSRDSSSVRPVVSAGRGLPAAGAEREPRIHVPASVAESREIVDAAVRRPAEGGGRSLLISVGGDGSHRETLSRIVAAGDEAARRLVVHRVPLGSGNDGADAVSLEESLRILAYGGRTRPRPVLRICGADAQNMYAFNVASFGLDAYVSLVTNRLNGYFPGDTYKLVADLVTLLYEPCVGVPRQEINVTDENGNEEQLSGRFMLCALGVSGRRSYGDGKPILPGTENLCAIRKVGLRGKLRLKKAVYAGTHLDHREVESRGARELVVRGDGTLPMQLDGEAMWIPRERFPVRCTVIPNALQAYGAVLDSGEELRTDSVL